MRSTISLTEATGVWLQVQSGQIVSTGTQNIIRMVDNQRTFILSLVLYRTAVLKESTQSCGLVDNRILDKSHNRQQDSATQNRSASVSQDS